MSVEDSFNPFCVQEDPIISGLYSVAVRTDLPTENVIHGEDHPSEYIDVLYFLRQQFAKPLLGNTRPPVTIAEGHQRARLLLSQYRKSLKHR